jgi:hypothetical protein
MFYQLHNILRSRQTNGFTGAGKRVMVATLLALLLPVCASAYAVVMRGGHQVLIPDEFAVTQTTLTYESAPGIYVTLQMSSIDIAATERANGEPEGGLLKRATRQPLPQAQPATASNAPRARKTLTNLDLEQTRLKRIESEAAYERRRKELGLPSREESERRREEEAVRAREMLNNSVAADAESESYWRARATALRNEIQVLDAEMSYVRARVAETPDTISTVSYATLGSPVPFIFSTRGATGQPHMAVNQSGGGNRLSLAQGVVGGVGFGGGQTRGRVFFRNSFGNFRRRGFAQPCLFAPCAPGFVGTYPYNNSSYDRSDLIARLRDLGTARAGLSARWRQLEDEARRAGAQPGWLRPY